MTYISKKVINHQLLMEMTHVKPVVLPVKSHCSLYGQQLELRYFQWLKVLHITCLISSISKIFRRDRDIETISCVPKKI